MSILEIIAIIFTLICVYLTAKQNIWCWPTGIVSVIAFFALYVSEKIYFQSILQIFFLAQSIYGWYNWNRGKNGEDLPVSKKHPLIIFRECVFVLVIFTIFGAYVSKYTDATLPYIDSISAGFALLATWYLTKKQIEAWLVWMSVNVLLFIVFLHQELYIVSILEVILFIISLYAYISWRKDLKMVSA